MKKTLKKMALNAVSKVASKTAENSANQTCLWWLYQPKVPAKVKKMRKF